MTPCVTLPAEVLAAIREETALNDHGEAYRLAAVAIGRPDLADRFAENRRQQLKLGHLSPALDSRRSTLYQQLLSLAKERLSPDGFARLRAAL